MCGRKSANLARIWRWKIGEKCGAVEPRKGVFARIFLRPRHCQILNNLSVIGLVMGHSPTSSPFGRNISSRNPVVPCSLDSPYHFVLLPQIWFDKPWANFFTMDSFSNISRISRAFCFFFFFIIIYLALPLGYRTYWIDLLENFLPNPRRTRKNLT